MAFIQYLFSTHIHKTVLSFLCHVHVRTKFFIYFHLVNQSSVITICLMFIFSKIFLLNQCTINLCTFYTSILKPKFWNHFHLLSFLLLVLLLPDVNFVTKIVTLFLKRLYKNNYDYYKLNYCIYLAHFCRTL